ncbi:MAG: oxygen-independent coproporphyrinogen III oxidase [Betaproteobacteria bacterium]|jgi:oxygen-independent coproporphyrinogen-3 oxidase|nr:oxygen-independent coproporphyrinogen III oxidase [Betaproteobacteria bacterium]
MRPDDLIIDANLIRQFDRAGPRYTSYPTADRFVEAFGPDAYCRALEERKIGRLARPLSLYVHLPFCSTICYYCACNKIITKDHGRSAKYLRYLGREMALVEATLGTRQRIDQLHWGGGTPTFLNQQELRELMGSIRSHFELDAQAECSIEVDPRSADGETIHTLAEVGFNRISVGVQDFDPGVQRAVNRIQSYEQTAAVVEAARAAGFKSVNVDLIYGLPKQDTERFHETINKVLVLNPDRIALYNYAHLPTVFKPQRRINEAEMPTAETRLDLMLLAIRSLTLGGFRYIGMDHFAKPGDDLATAQRLGTLHRNFQGYTTRPECDLVGLGVSAIGAVGPAYAQNVKTLDEYYDCLDQGKFAVLRGIELTKDDLVRRAVIQALMCSFEVSIEAIEVGHLIDFKRYFAPELQELREYASMGLVDLDDEWITVTPRGRLLVRAVCMIFDYHLRTAQARARYSKVI